MMKPTAFSALTATLLCMLVGCQNVQTQSRMLISNPEDGSPPVIQIQSSSGATRSFVAGQGDSPAVPPDGILPGREMPIAEEAAGEGLTPSLERPALPAPRRHVYNSVKTSAPVVAMTFDDGPHPTLTPELLDLLKSRGIKATFYVIGRNVEAYPDIARRIVEEGHEIANHSWSHPSLSKIGATRVKSEIEKTTAIIERTTGVRPTNMRPPYGATNSALNRRMNEEFGLAVIMWSVDPQDWRYRSSGRVSSHLIANAKPGDILLAHDIHASTIAAMPATFDALLAKGLRFVTVSELLAMDAQEDAPAAASAAVPGSLPAM